LIIGTEQEWDLQDIRKLPHESGRTDVITGK
jgi:hypothetical protein